MWLSGAGEFCYFSQKKDARLVLLDALQICQMKVRKLKDTELKDKSALSHAFELSFPGSAPYSNMHESQLESGMNVHLEKEHQSMETMYYAANSEEECETWIKAFTRVSNLDLTNGKHA